MARKDNVENEDRETETPEVDETPETDETSEHADGALDNEVAEPANDDVLEDVNGEDRLEAARQDALKNSASDQPVE